ncbi:hypothetical protein C7B82_00150 [Stenomitos frigidus ULC18]|uniref:DUF2079 domain-containing protein n=1 Tax=Stenomitos frigidus ULC18 TaxID=2107698 RepID=A0A2T1ESY9_9CYAN|nr:hypothetical protein C7B82_00150 [Stenomitos frigidus ULC18]
MEEQPQSSNSINPSRSDLRTIWGSVIVSTTVLFVASSVRHLLFQSAAFDLGYFDQALYLISQGQPPIVSFWGFHFLGGHADWILYLLAPLYKLYPSVFWLFAIQAIALSLGAVPAWQLATQAGVKPKQAVAIAFTYLLYPLVFNINLFDFHPEVMALPVFLAVVLAARTHQPVGFTLGIIFILGCRDALSLTVAAMGVWLFFIENRRLCGAIAFLGGSLWFLVATQLVIPHFRPLGVEAVARYAGLGDSVLEIAKNVILQPGLLLNRVLTLPNLEYLCLLLVPVLWGLSLKHLAPLLAAIPQLAMNLLTAYQPQKDLIHQYSVPILPFLLLAVIAALAANKSWVRSQRGIILWALIGFLALAKFGYFGDRYLAKVNTWQATRAAIAQVQTTGSVLTNPQTAPHLTHRAVIRLATDQFNPATLNDFSYVLLDTRYPGMSCSKETMSHLLKQAQQSSSHELTYQRDDVYLFTRKPL